MDTRPIRGAIFWDTVAAMLIWGILIVVGLAISGCGSTVGIRGCFGASIGTTSLTVTCKTKPASAEPTA